MVWKLQIVIDVWNSCSEKLFRSALVWNLLSFVNSTQNFIWWLVNGMKTSDCHHMKLSPSEKNSIYSLKSLMSPSEHVTIWKNYSLSYQYEHVTIWFVTKCILFIPVTILVWNFKMVTGMNSSYQAFIWWHLSPYGGLVWKIFKPVTKKAVQMVMVWEVLP